MKRSGFRTALMTCAVLTVTACGGGEERAGHGITTGFAVSTLDNPFFAAMKDGGEQAAAAGFRR